MPRQPCPRCGQNRWYQHRNQQVTCLCCGLVALDASGAEYVPHTPTINGVGSCRSEVSNAKNERSAK